MAATVLVVEDERKLRDGPAADDRLEATWALSLIVGLAAVALAAAGVGNRDWPGGSGMVNA